MTGALADAAAFIAQQWPVLPCDAQKRAILKDWPNEATRDPLSAREMFSRPGAVNIGVTTGPRSNLLVLDLDVKNGAQGLEWLAANQHRLPRTRQHATRSGGRHILFAYPEGRTIKNSVGKIANGVDVRGINGYVVFPPSEGYSITDDAMPAEAPAWLLAILDPPAPPPRPVQPYRAPQDMRGTRNALAALENECHAIANARHGHKHDTLNKAAYSIGGWVAGGELDDAMAFARLQDALDAMHARQPCEDYRAAVRTLHASYADGKTRPRYTPERPVTIRLEVIPPEPPPRDEPPAYWEAEPVLEPEDSIVGQVSPPTRPAAIWIDAEAWDEAAIPKRPWIAPGYLLRNAVSALSGQGSGGKSSLTVAWTISLATGLPIGEFRPTGPLIVVNYNVEDDKWEQHRRYSAAAKAAGVTMAEIASRVIRCGPSTIGTLFERNPDTGRIAPTAAMDALETLLMETGADVLVCDPLAELHNAEENDNTAMRLVIAAFRALAQRLGIAILILHHDRKGTNAPGDMDRMRGASAITGAVRVMLTLTPMSVEEADKFGIPPEERRRHFRIDGAKSNYALAQEAEWWKLAGIELDNGETVAACQPWQPPSALADMSLAMAVDIVGAIHRGLNGFAFAARKQAGTDWAGKLMTGEKYRMTDGQAAAALASWTASGLLIEGEQPSPRRGHTRRAYTVNIDALQEMRQQVRGDE